MKIERNKEYRFTVLDNGGIVLVPENADYARPMPACAYSTSEDFLKDLANADFPEGDKEEQE